MGEAVWRTTEYTADLGVPLETSDGVGSAAPPGGGARGGVADELACLSLLVVGGVQVLLQLAAFALKRAWLAASDDVACLSRLAVTKGEATRGRPG